MERKKRKKRGKANLKNMRGKPTSFWRAKKKRTQRKFECVGRQIAIGKPLPWAFAEPSVRTRGESRRILP